MDSAGAATSPFDSFKSKKALRSSVNKPHSFDEPLEAPVQTPWSSKTPEKSIHPPQRRLTRRQAPQLVKQVREAAKQIRKSDLKPSGSSDPLTSSTVPTATPITKPNTSKALPEKYEILNKFFNSLESSIRLLVLKRSVTTFTNISRMVESLTDRRFAYRHLAQLKFILPEGIEIKKILVRDDQTSCIKPDLMVTLNFSVVQKDEKQKSDSGSLQMRKLFRSRLLKFCESNAEGDEIPEEKLPEPFDQLCATSSDAMGKTNLKIVNETPSAILELPLSVASHINPSFRRQFSKYVLSHNVETVKQESAKLATRTQVAQVADHPSTNVAKRSSKLLETPMKSFGLERKKDLSSTIGSPAEHIPTPFSVTPAQAALPPGRCFMTPDEDLVMSPCKLTRRSSGIIRSMTFDTPLRNKASYAKRASATVGDDLCDILSDDLLASIKENERKAVEKNDPAISQAKWRKHMIAGLPRFFDTLLFFFQSIKRSVINKEELIHKILSNPLEIVDQREVVEQLRLLQELAPEWIYEKTSNGDIYICINKRSSPELIRTRLSEAY